ncbi:hypothetical protein F9B16_21305 [Actinomadura montaniterrae]|uniref:Uncharacterized protein n=1 Tax=Actinomadura montaniterrae TaxID=1803903 RepID=A0A6L3VR33_9ACTN|nr:hypothetical protein F9B16_21305 [Actinomadura montaniterrae]
MRAQLPNDRSLTIACDHLRDRLLFALLLDCGVRIGEAFGLRHDPAGRSLQHRTRGPVARPRCRTRAGLPSRRTGPAVPGLPDHRRPAGEGDRRKAVRLRGRVMTAARSAAE